MKNEKEERITFPSDRSKMADAGSGFFILTSFPSSPSLSFDLNLISAPLNKDGL